MNRRGLLIQATLTVTLTACAVGPNDVVYHGVIVECERSLDSVTNVIYSYGDELKNVRRKVITPIGSVFISPMKIPDMFFISWETPDGKRREAQVPVRGQLRRGGMGSGDNIVFVITAAGDVQGYVEMLRTGNGKRERFY